VEGSMWVLRRSPLVKYLQSWRSNLSMWQLWTIWTNAHTTPRVRTEVTREKEDKKNMARRKLTVAEQLKGVRAALRSKRTPPQLRQGLQERAKWLGRQIEKRHRRKGA